MGAALIVLLPPCQEREHDILHRAARARHIASCGESPTYCIVRREHDILRRAELLFNIAHHYVPVGHMYVEAELSASARKCLLRIVNTVTASSVSAVHSLQRLCSVHPAACRLFTPSGFQPGPRAACSRLKLAACRLYTALVAQPGPGATCCSRVRLYVLLR